MPGVVWGEGDDRVFQVVGVNHNEEWFDVLGDRDPQLTTVRGDRAAVIPVGDPPVGVIMIGWSSDDCDYTVWIGPGLTLKEAIAYARRY